MAFGRKLATRTPVALLDRSGQIDALHSKDGIFLHRLWRWLMSSRWAMMFGRGSTKKENPQRLDLDHVTSEL